MGEVRRGGGGGEVEEGRWKRRRGGGGEEEGKGGNKGCYSHTCDPHTDTNCVKVSTSTARLAS